MIRLAIVALSCVTAFSSVVTPAEAFPIINLRQAQMSDVQNIQYRGDRGNMRGEWNRDYWHRRHYGDRHRGYYGRGGYYGRRYYRDHHHDNAGAIIGGLAAGAIIGGIIASQQRAYVGRGGHTSWCYSRYRSYRAYDNTFQPYNGPRRQCYSPYR
ncbi:BA14K family protein [Rhizobium sp. NXC24]|uniref:BA14K family protein n=1 Tax=Rhizobium sp. NXC24 TaxID=2048897 RepID=UPI000CDF36BC|nr:BA14K family protein [Rhizobium sp. NXC24]AVA24327.1 BA14K-like protein [Rhizobium sp. NXC24]